jgi:hypothetical protein
LGVGPDAVLGGLLVERSPRLLNLHGHGNWDAGADQLLWVKLWVVIMFIRDKLRAGSTEIPQVHRFTKVIRWTPAAREDGAAKELEDVGVHDELSVTLQKPQMGRAWEWWLLNPFRIFLECPKSTEMG